MLKNASTNPELFEFTLKLNAISFNEDVANTLYEAGCDDALFTSDARGVYLDFCRESESLHTAITSAIADVKKAGFDATVYEENCVYAR
ncbi:MAG: hypothetical protein ACRC0B_04795 [Legionella sp.]